MGDVRYVGDGERVCVSMEGQSAAIIHYINDRLEDELSTMFRVCPDTADADIR